ncbi:MAG: hypothetical protein R2730_07275 [Chitinophagales bacterium]
MRTKKIRGHKRRWTAIDRWVANDSILNLDHLRQYERNYSKMRVHPWNGILMTNSKIQTPTGITRLKLLQGLFTIYDQWKTALDTLGEPYYLKIWLFEPRWMSSQVVCAIGNALNFYEQTFYQPSESKEFKSQNYGALRKELEAFNWEYRYDEDHFDNSFIGQPEHFNNRNEYESNKRWFEKKLIQPHRTIQLNEPYDDITELYSFKIGDVWLGEKV